MSQAELAERMGEPRKTISEIINGKAAITPETAIQLERVLGIPASFGIIANDTTEALARKEEQERLSKQVSGSTKYPEGHGKKAGFSSIKTKLSNCKKSNFSA